MLAEREYAPRNGEAHGLGENSTARAFSSAGRRGKGGADHLSMRPAVNGPVPSTRPGVYAFNNKANLMMAGRWSLILSAKVPNEWETTDRTVVFLAG